MEKPIMEFNLRTTSAAMILAALLAGCNNSAPTAEKKASETASADSATAAATTAAPASSEEEQVVKIASVAPMSGPQAHFGKDNANGVQMAIDDLNAKGMVIGGKKIRFEVMVEDDAADPKQATSVAQKICDAKANGVVGHLNSGTTIPASAIYNNCGIPMVTGAATNPELTKQGYKTTFRIIANDNTLGAALADKAKAMGLKRIAVIDDRTAYGQGLAEVFSEVAKKNGIEIVSQQFTNDKATDFMGILTEIKGQKPEAIFYGGMDAQVASMLRQMEQMGMNDVKVFGGDGICTTSLHELAGESSNTANVICAEGGVALHKMPSGKEWKARYDASFPDEFQLYGAYTYDAAMLIADAMKRADSVDPKVYLAELTASNYDGVTAKISFMEDGNIKNAASTISTYVDGKKTAIE